MQTSLWFTAADLAAARQRLADGEPTTTRLAELAEQVTAQNVPRFVTGRAVLHLLTGRGGDAGLEAWRTWAAAWSPSDLARASVTLHGALLHEACGELWQPADTAMLRRLGESFRFPGRDNPHQIANNWWAVTHAAAYLAARCTGEEEEAAWAAGRLRAFCQHFGDAGLYHEGLGYQCYTLAFLLPALLALGEWPACFRKMGASLYATAVNRWPIADSNRPVHFGAMLSWNDAGQCWPQSNITSLLIAVAEPAQRGALRTLFDRLSGVASPTRELAPELAGWFFHLFYYPYDVPPADPDAVLPHAICDSRQGLAVFRHRYCDAHDAVLGAYARVTHVGGHAHNDAGSVRFMALGHDWILGGGQARPNAEWQSVVTPVSDTQRRRYDCGHVIWYDPAGVFGMDLRQPHGGYSERYVAVRWPGTLAMLDLIDDHRTDRTWVWNLTFAPHLTCTLRADGFDLVAPDGANLRAQFLGTQPDRLTREQMPDSTRRFSTGTTIHYPGRPFIRAHFARQKHLGIYAVLSVQSGPPPAIRLVDGLDVQIGDTIWRRPFGVAVPAAFRLGQSGTLCRYPAGRVH